MLTDGKWSDLSATAQFLLDLEFLTHHTQPGQPGGASEVACVYTRTPPYLQQIAYQFPWVHFYGFQHRTEEPEDEGEEYDPDRPAVRWTSQATLHTEHNRTVSPFEFSKDSAVTLSKAKEARPEHRLVMICHGETETRQVVLHALLRADASLLDVCGTIPADYLEGQLVLPIGLPQNRLFACLVASHPCKCAEYDPALYEQEMGAPCPYTCMCLVRLRLTHWEKNRLLPEHDTHERGVRPRKPGFNHRRARPAVRLVPPRAPRRGPAAAQVGRGRPVRAQGLTKCGPSAGKDQTSESQSRHKEAAEARGSTISRHEGSAVVAARSFWTNS